MPTYEYVCSKCEHRFDVFQAITEKPLTVCPKEKCSLKRWGKGKVKRAIGTGAGIIFKGSGFYVTDYRSEGYKEAAKKEAPPAAPSTSGDGKPSAKAETKPAPQSESKAAKPKSDGK
ncbi:MAG: FmdB family transcriptional regulator [Verrucomicrobia bacterium]|nr:MAG: FmdB family transcriptional regulator [Verrucomicrobiota bacterium]